jgi:uridine kinase
MITAKLPLRNLDQFPASCTDLGPQSNRRSVQADTVVDARIQPQAFVIAITGLSGAGKSTLVRALAKRISHVAFLHYDDYSPFLVGNRSGNRRLYMAAARQSLKNSLWDNEKVIADLTALRVGKTILNPLTGKTTEPAQVIFMDGPFGRTHPGFGHLIDFSIALDIPLEIALARRLLQICRSQRAQTDPAEMRTQYIEVLQAYLEGSLHKSHLRIRQKALAGADLVLDALLATEDQVVRVLGALPGVGSQMAAQNAGS